MTNRDQKAYPFSYEEEYGDHGQKQLITHFGITKREYFAAMAMQGCAVNNDLQFKVIATAAVLLADALINELNKAIE